MMSIIDFVSRRRLSAAAICALLAALALRSGAPRALRAESADDGSAALTLEVQEDVRTSDEPFSPPVAFVLHPGGTGDVRWSGAEEADAFAGIRRWQIQIYDFDDRKVHFIQGMGRPPARRIVWDGTDRDGRLLRDGFYTARLVWLDASGAARKSAPVKVGLLSPPGLSDIAKLAAEVGYTNDGLVIRLTEALVFSPGQWELRPQSFAALEKISAFLQRYPRHRLVVVGHADSVGSADRNREISLKRALSIHGFLRSHGVDGERLAYEGRGSDEPIASNSTPEGRERNRRVEIIVLKVTI